MIRIVVGSTGAVVARAVVVALVVGAAGGDFVRRAGAAGTGVGARARGGRVIGRHVKFGL